MTIHPSYTGDRPDLRAHVPAGARRVLDLGCSVGAVGAALKEEAGRVVVGVERDPDAARQAQDVLDRVVVGSLDEPKTWKTLEGELFDCVILGDVLEHCIDPWRVLGRAAARLEAGGRVILSVPNVAHYSTLVALARRRWPLNPRGIHDRTHLRWFAEKNVRELVEEAGLRIRTLIRKYRVIEVPHRANRWAWVLAVPGLRTLLTHQFIVVAER